MTLIATRIIKNTLLQEPLSSKFVVQRRSEFLLNFRNIIYHKILGS